MTDFLKKSLDLGFGVLLVTKENINELIDDMVKKGEVRKDEAISQIKEALGKVLPNKEEIETRTEEIIKKILHKLDIPTRNELQEMQKKLEKILERLNSTKE
ncbi:MAG: phasin family protein [Candidatus Brocadiaceae bacterium]|nr:phasin family protein [Candidatus Brocadiaceae bacterium]